MLRLDYDAYLTMVAHAIDGVPDEACGLLAAPANGDTGNIHAVYKCRNAAASARVYEIHPLDHLHADRDADSRGLQISGVYHSHTHTEAYPSPTDIREAHYPDAVFVIVSFEDRDHPYSKGYLIHKQDWRDATGEVEEVELVIE